MLTSLPLELFDLVNQHLSTQDKFNCLFVCQAWYSSFRLALYQHCIINSSQSCRSFHTSLQNGQTSGLGGQVRVLDTSHCELTLQDLQSLFKLCPNLRDSRFRWHQSYLYEEEITDCQKRMWNHQTNPPVRPAAKTNFADQHRQQPQSHQRLITLSHLSLCGYLTQLTLHSGDLAGLFSVVTHLPALEQLHLISVKMDMTLDDMERIHATCPRITSLSLDIHTLLSTMLNLGSPVAPSSSYLCNLPMMSHMRRLKLVYKNLEKPGRSPWIRYLAHKYPGLTSLEMQTRFVHRRNYWQWNRMNNNIDDEGLLQQQQLQDQTLENMEDHPEFRSGLKQWAQSCRYLTRIHFVGIPWDRWFLKHLPIPREMDTHQQQQFVASQRPPQHVKHIHVVRVDDDLDAAAATFVTLVNHPSLNQLTHLTLRPVATHPDSSFYKALGQLGSLTSLTIQQQGIRSNKLSPCQVDILQLLESCQNLDVLTIGGMAAVASSPKKRNDTDHKHLRTLNLSTTNISHTTLQHILSFCPSLTRFYFISCEYEAALEHGIPILAIDHAKIQWKEVHIRYPFIQSPQTQQYHQPIGLSGSRRRGGTPRYLSILDQQQNDRWIYWTDETRQRTLEPAEIGTIVGIQQKDHTLRQEGLEFGRIKVVCHSIQSICINGTRIRL